MAERFTFDPESCYADLNLSPDPEWELDTLIGRAGHARILLGSLPYLDDSEQPVSFHPFQINAPAFTPGRAFLFTGQEGCGKRALDTAFAFRVFDDYGKNSFRCYRIPLKRICGSTKEETVQRMDAMLSALDVLRKKESYSEVCLYLSLGDLKPVLRKKRFAERFADWLEQVLSSPDGMCIVTAYYDGEQGDLPGCLRRLFTVLHLDPPDTAQRRTFFTMMTKRYPLVISEMQPEEFADKTEGFSFRMLRRISDLYFSWTMAALQEEGCQPEDFISGKALRSFTVPAKVSGFILQNVRAELRHRKPRMPGEMLFAARTPGDFPNSAPPPPPERPEEPPQEQKHDKEPVKSVAQTLDRPSAVREFAKSLRPVCRLQVNATEHNGYPRPNVQAGEQPLEN